MVSIQLQNRLVIIVIALYLFAIPLIIFKIEPYSTYGADTQVTLLFTAYLVLFAMIEGYSTYMQVVHKCLKDDGLFLLHTIGGNKSITSTDPWIHKYVFPNGMLPSIKQLGNAIEGLFVMEDWHNFSADYDKTLMSWHKNFESNWHKIMANYDERFYRMWNYYLLSCAGSFRARNIQLWQIVLSKNGVPGGYTSIR